MVFAVLRSPMIKMYKYYYIDSFGRAADTLGRKVKSILFVEPTDINRIAALVSAGYRIEVPDDNS